MKRDKYLHDNHDVNLNLKGVTSILIGGYLFGAVYLLKNILSGFLVDDNVVGMFSAQIIELIAITIFFLVFLFSSLTLVFAGKRIAKKHQYKLWNSQTIKMAFRYFVFQSIVFISLILLMNEGLINNITPTFLILYSLFLVLFKNNDRKQLLILSGLAFCLGVLCFFIPSYWASALSILAIAHMAYGVVVR